MCQRLGLCHMFRAWFNLIIIFWEMWNFFQVRYCLVYVFVMDLHALGLLSIAANGEVLKIFLSGFQVFNPENYDKMVALIGLKRVFFIIL